MVLYYSVSAIIEKGTLIGGAPDHKPYVDATTSLIGIVLHDNGARGTTAIAVDLTAFDTYELYHKMYALGLPMKGIGKRILGTRLILYSMNHRRARDCWAEAPQDMLVHLKDMSIPQELEELLSPKQHF